MHGGLLAARGNAGHEVPATAALIESMPGGNGEARHSQDRFSGALSELSILSVQVVNLYPFQEAVRSRAVSNSMELPLVKVAKGGDFVWSFVSFAFK